MKWGGNSAKRGWHAWIRWAFIAWAVVSTAWLVNTFRTSGVDPLLLESSASVAVEHSGAYLEFRPAGGAAEAGLVFLTGGAVAAEAYAPMLRPLADSGYHVVVVRLPWRLAPLDSHRREAMQRALSAPGLGRPGLPWVLAGHSLGGALACRVVAAHPERFSELVLLEAVSRIPARPAAHDFSIRWCQRDADVLYGTSRSDGAVRAENHGQPEGLWPIFPIAALGHGPRRPCYCDPCPALHSKKWADNGAYGYS